MPMDATDSSSISLTQPNLLVINLASQNNVSVNGGNDGSATVQVTGGQVHTLILEKWHLR